MVVEDNTIGNSGNEDNGNSNSNVGAEPHPPLATVTCLDIAWSAVRRPFDFLPGVNPLDFAALFSPLARSFQYLKRQTQTNAATSAAAPPAAQRANNQPSAAPNPNTPPQDEPLNITHAEFRDFLLAVKASFDGVPHLWQRFSQLARDFMLSHSDPPPPKSQPA